jgi:Tfp pilus assembly protein PilF
MQEGHVWLAQSNYKKALSTFKNAWQRQQTAEMARLLFSASKPIESFEIAIKPLLSCIQDNPDDTATQLFLAFTYLSSERNEEAIREYEKILNKTPEDTALLNNLAWLYSLEENPKALDFAERAFRLSPQDTGVLDTYGWILVQRNQIEKGKRLIYLAMQKSPGNLEIQYHYAAALIQSGDEDNGAQLLEKLLKDNAEFSGKYDAEVLLKKTTH